MPYSKLLVILPFDFLAKLEHQRLFNKSKLLLRIEKTKNTNIWTIKLTEAICFYWIWHSELGVFCLSVSGRSVDHKETFLEFHIVIIFLIFWYIFSSFAQYLHFFQQYFSPCRFTLPKFDIEEMRKQKNTPVVTRSCCHFFPIENSSKHTSVFHSFFISLPILTLHLMSMKKCLGSTKVCIPVNIPYNFSKLNFYWVVDATLITFNHITKLIFKENHFMIHESKHLVKWRKWKSGKLLPFRQ